MPDISRPQGHAIQPPYRRGLSRAEAAGYVGVSPSTFDKMVFAGGMPRPKRIGTRNVWDVRALDVAFDGLPGDDEPSASNEWDSTLP